MARAKKVTAPTLGAALAGATVAPWQFVTAADVEAVQTAVKTAESAVSLAVNKTLDGIRSRLVGPIADALKGNAKTSPLRAEVGRFADAVFPETVRNSYASGIIVALEFGIPWTASIHKQGKTLRADRAAAKEAERIKAGGKPREPSKSGPVCRTSWASALKTAERLAEQLKMLQAGAAMVKSAEALKTKVAAKVAAK